MCPQDSLHLQFCPKHDQYCVLQRDLHHWIPLLNHFDDYLERTLYGRADIDLRDLSKPEPEADFPKRNVLSILKTTWTLLRTCLHKQLYNSLEVRTLSLMA